MQIRTAREGDAGGMLRLLRRLDRETRFMMYEPGERKTTVQAQREALRDTLASDNATVLLAEEDGHPVGFLDAIGGAFRRNRHVARLVVGVVGGYTGRGIGAASRRSGTLGARGRSSPPGAHRDDAQPCGGVPLRKGGLRRRGDEDGLDARRRFLHGRVLHGQAARLILLSVNDSGLWDEVVAASYAESCGGLASFSMRLSSS